MGVAESQPPPDMVLTLKVQLESFTSLRTRKVCGTGCPSSGALNVSPVCDVYSPGLKTVMGTEFPVTPFRLMLSV